jgi:hypothetical protein
MLKAIQSNSRSARYAQGPQADAAQRQAAT